MSDFGQSLKLKYIRETRRFYKILWKDTGHFRPNNRTFRTFQNPTLRLGEADKTQTQSQTPRLRIAKTDFKSVRKTIMVEDTFFKIVLNRF